MPMIDTQVIRISEQALLISMQTFLISMAQESSDNSFPDMWLRGHDFAVTQMIQHINKLEKESKKRAI